MYTPASMLGLRSVVDRHAKLLIHVRGLEGTRRMCPSSPRMTVSACRLDGSPASDEIHRRRQCVCAISIPCVKAEAQTAAPRRLTTESHAVDQSPTTDLVRWENIPVLLGINLEEPR